MKNICLLVFISISFYKSSAQTIGLFQHDSGTVDNGYVLYSPMYYTKTFLIDKCGKEVHEWNSNYTPGLSTYLSPTGNLIRTGCIGNIIFMAGGNGGIIEKTDWNNNVLWSYKISGPLECQHHDIRELPDGNILAIVWEKKTQAEAILAGRNPALVTGQGLWSEKIIEIRPVGDTIGDIIWEWHLWDHLIQDFDSTKLNYGTVSDHPELVNLNFTGSQPSNPDWIHMNSVDYNLQLNQVILTPRNFSELWIIDHSTNINQAASHSGGNSGKGGDLLYRWGNPQTYDLGTVADRKLFEPHNSYWIPSGYPNAGNIMIFNNGVGRPNGTYSSVDIISPPVDSSGVYNSSLPYGPSGLTWTYQAPVPTDFFSDILSGAQMLANGNVEICSGYPGIFFEVDSSKNTVWKYINPVDNNGPETQNNIPISNSVFRTDFYYSDYSGFNGQTLIAGQPIELNPLPYSCELDTASFVNTGISKSKLSVESILIYPNPASDEFKLKISNVDLKNSSVRIFDLAGREVFLPFANNNSEITFNCTNLKEGLYLISFNDGKNLYWKKLVISK